jgi:transposase
MHRKKSKANRSRSVNLQVLPVIHPDAAGIDVGAKEHLVAVPCDRDPQPVRTFQAFTPELHELDRWLKRCGIKTVALESTGIYWISLYEVLEQYGFEIRVVNARHVKHVPGRTKTDVLDCQWIQKLHQLRSAQLRTYIFYGGVWVYLHRARSTSRSAAMPDGRPVFRVVIIRQRLLQLREQHAQPIASGCIAE